ncbi:F-box only protein 27-like [Polypterus senegalus]|nr:F-box only protein 27-like [Polypterus senegalus]XP_039618155.1 F-box only protein 27-like [Polypterus senegalus]
MHSEEMGQASHHQCTERNVKDVKFVMDLSEVSDDILFLILIHVPFCELITNCRLVCKRWKDVVNSQALWRVKYEQALSKKLQSRLPSHTNWKNLFFKLFARNLIKNPCGDDGFEHWNVNHGGDGWVIEHHHGELKNTTSPNCFVTSFWWCKKTQCIDLLEEGFEEHFLDDFQPDILINDWYGSRHDCGAKYKIKVHLLNSRKEPLMSFKRQYPEIPQWNNSSYYKVQHVFHNYGPGVRFIFFSHQGTDNKFWAGHYGARIANSTVKCCRRPLPFRDTIILEGPEERKQTQGITSPWLLQCQGSKELGIWSSPIPLVPTGGAAGMADPFVTALPPHSEGLLEEDHLEHFCVLYKRSQLPLL